MVQTDEELRRTDDFQAGPRSGNELPRYSITQHWDPTEPNAGIGSTEEEIRIEIEKQTSICVGLTHLRSQRVGQSELFTSQEIFLKQKMDPNFTAALNELSLGMLTERDEGGE